VAETIYGTKGMWTPLIKDKGINDDDYEIVRLKAGAVVGDFVTYDGQVTAATPATHRDVKLALAVNADTQVANMAQGWCGQIMEPVLTPDPVAGVAWSPSVALAVDTLVRILKKGARATTACIADDTGGHDHIIGELMSLGAAGHVKPMINTYTDTTPTGPQNAAVIIASTIEVVGRLAEVSEDISNESVVFIDWSGY
jgi:hypothetical protein